MSSARNKVKEFFGQLAKERKSEEFYGFLGDRTGQVIADDYSNVWVLLYNGQVVLARNKVAPTVPRIPVAVGYTADDPKLLQVLRVLNVHDRSTTPYLPPHSKTHTWPGVDTVPIRAEQFLPGLAMPSGGMVVQYYGWPYKIGTTWHLANHSTHDFTSYIPDSGAIWVGVEIDASGVITYNSSTSKDSRDLLAPEDIAETPTDRRLLFAVKVYVGQTEVIKNELDTDLFDPRFAASSEGGGGGGTVESVTGDGVDNTDPANPVLTYPTPGDIGADVAGAAAAAQTAAEAYADSLVVGLWDDRGTFDASGGAYPSSGGSGTAGAIKKGDIWTVSVAGTLPTSQVVEVGDTVRALVDSPGNTQANWAIGQNNIGYVAENSANKATSMTGNETSNILYLTAKAVYDWATGLFVQKNSSITSATKTKITYDTKGLVTAGADATTADIADSSGKRYVPDSSASNDFLVGSGSAWVKKTLAETITILRTSLDSVYAALVHTHAASDIVSGTLAAARLPAPTTTDLGGVKRNTGTSGQFVTGIDSGGALTYDTPAGGGGDGWTAYSAVIPTRDASPLDGTFTVTIASPAVLSKTAHGLLVGRKIRLTTTGALPTGLAINTDYYVVEINANTFSLATSLTNAFAGTKINTSGSQSGTHSIVVQTDPTYYLKFSGVDLTAVLYEGMPIKWTQNSIVRYGWISSAPAYAGSNTTFSVLTRTDSTSSNYDVLDTSIYAVSNFAYGLPRQPGTGFPAYREMWDVIVNDTTAYVKSSPTANVWYKAMDSGYLPSIFMPEGRWNLSWSALMYGSFTSGFRAECGGTLSTTTSTEVDKELTNFVSFRTASTGSVYLYSAASRNKDVIMTSPALYHFLLLTSLSSQTSIGVDNYITNQIKAKCNYL